MNITKNLLKAFVLCLISFISFSCSNNDEPDYGPEGSPRDWTYFENQIQFYVNGIEQTSVTEITVRSTPVELYYVDDVFFPVYDSTFKVKGFPKKGETVSIKVRAELDSFEGTATIDGINYNVSGEFTGDPFEHYSKMGIIMYLNQHED